VALGLLAALVTTVTYGLATVLQSVGTRRLAVAPVDPRLLLRMARSLPYLAGLALDGVGFVASLLALRVLPLFLVQSAVAASIGVTALGARIWLGARLSRREQVDLVVLAGGLLLLALSAQAEGASPLSRAGQWLVLALALLVAVLAAAIARAPGGPAATALAAAAGLGFAGVGVASRAIDLGPPWWPVLGEPLLWALAVAGLVAMTCLAAALQRGRVTVVAGVTLAVETVLPAVVGFLWLGDRTRPGFLPVAVLGLLLTLVGGIGLARHAEPEIVAAP